MRHIPVGIVGIIFMFLWISLGTFMIINVTMWWVIVEIAGGVPIGICLCILTPPSTDGDLSFQSFLRRIFTRR